MYYLLEIQMAKCSLVAHSYMIELLTKKTKNEKTKNKKQLHYVYKKPLSDHSPHRLKMEKLPASQWGQISLSGIFSWQLRRSLGEDFSQNSAIYAVYATQTVQ